MIEVSDGQRIVVHHDDPIELGERERLHLGKAGAGGSIKSEGEAFSTMAHPAKAQPAEACRCPSQGAIRIGWVGACHGFEHLPSAHGLAHFGTRVSLGAAMTEAPCEVNMASTGDQRSPETTRETGSLLPTRCRLSNSLSARRDCERYASNGLPEW